MIETLEQQGTQELEGPLTEGPQGGYFDAMRRSENPLHRAGADVIERALSRSSLEFMHAVRQEQGQ